MLVQDLLDSGIPSSGTTVENRLGFDVKVANNGVPRRREAKCGGPVATKS